MSQIMAREVFNPNEGPEEGGFPVFEDAFDVATYANFFMNIAPTPFESWCTNQAVQLDSARKSRLEGLETKKAIALPPEMQSFARFSLMPEQWNGGIVQWPGIPPDALRKVVRENLAPQVIINMRVDDVLRYAHYSAHPWMPGWHIRMREGLEAPDEGIKEDVKKARAFLENCNIEVENARERDAKGYPDFPTFLGELVRDSLTYDGMAVFTDMDLGGKVKAFKPFSSFNIRLALPSGYMGDPNIYAVAVDEAGNVIHTFTRYQLIFRHRNSRADADIFGYGYPEIEQTIRLIQAFQNAMDMNGDVFTRNSMPNGFLVAKGQMGQRQLDVLSRIWINLRRGVTKQWAIPVIPVPKDGDIEIKDLSNLKDMDVYYADFMNMVAGLFCAMYRFPVRRLGYHISGKTKDNEPEVPSTLSPGIDDYDPYIAVLLNHIEALINQYLLWSRWPHLSFSFTAKSPKDDARQYEARVLACSVDERRALSDMEPLAEIEGLDADQKELMKILGGAPVDPAMGGIYQSAIQAVLGTKNDAEDGGTPGARMTSKKDPGRSEDHGHTAGVRRNSAAETKKSEEESQDQ